ncbi:MAG: AbrB/MazE/SpoVT family DNA-binding domain-containing protein [Fidelibacterota bacterium]
MTSKGQVTIPKKIRQYLQINKSDKIDFKIADDGKVYIEAPKTSIVKFSGILSKYKTDKPLTIEKMDEIIATESVKRAHK